MFVDRMIVASKNRDIEEAFLNLLNRRKDISRENLIREYEVFLANQPQITDQVETSALFSHFNTDPNEQDIVLPVFDLTEDEAINEFIRFVDDSDSWKKILIKQLVKAAIVTPILISALGAAAWIVGRFT